MTNIERLRQNAVFIDSHDWDGYWGYPDRPENSEDNEFCPTVFSKCGITWDNFQYMSYAGSPRMCTGARIYLSKMSAF